ERGEREEGIREMLDAGALLLQRAEMPCPSLPYRRLVCVEAAGEELEMHRERVQRAADLVRRRAGQPRQASHACRENGVVVSHQLERVAVLVNHLPAAKVLHCPPRRVNARPGPGSRL